MKMFGKAYIGNCELKNRIIRSATFEGMADADGTPKQSYIDYYDMLSKHAMGAIITGFIAISPDGKAVQTGQAALYTSEHKEAFTKVTEKVHANGNKLFLQIAHTGRQTRSSETGYPIKGASTKPSPFFRERPQALKTVEVHQLVTQFVETAYLAQQAGFDGIQLHAAHGYLIHQFLLPSINKRKDEYAIDLSTQLGTRFLEQIIDGIRRKCDAKFALLLKVSGSDDYRRCFSKEQFVNFIKFIDTKPVDAIEVSYGTMDQALNIFRGDVPVNVVLKHNKLYKTNNRLKRAVLKGIVFPLVNSKLIPFSPLYNLPYAELAKQHTLIPIISVGGFRSGIEMEAAISAEKTDFVSLSRPLICEPDFVEKVKHDINYQSKCTNCNYCAIMCDSNLETKCYLPPKASTLD